MRRRSGPDRLHKNMQSKGYSSDVVVVGAGPVGLAALFQLGMLGLRAIVVDPRPDIGGQCAALYPEKPIFDIPGFESIAGRELVARLEAQAAPFSPTMLLGRQVVDVLDLPDDALCVVLDDETRIEARALIVASGAGAIRPRRPNIPDIADFEEGAIAYAVDDVDRFRDTAVVIAGGGDSAADWALHLSDVARELWLVHRRDKFACAPETERRLRAAAAANRIRIVTPFQLERVHGSPQRLSRIDIASLDGDRRSIQADHLIACFGLESELGPIAEWRLRCSKAGIPVDPATMATDRAGIYAIGDVALYPGKRRLILCGFSEAAICAAGVFARLHPAGQLPQGHSTSCGVVGLESSRSDASAA